LRASQDDKKRLYTSVLQAMKASKGIIKIVDRDNTKEQFFSKYLMDAESGISYDEPQPNTFSFNSPYGACPKCDGLGYIFEIDKNIVIPDKKLSIQKGAIVPLGALKESWNSAIIRAAAKRFEISLTNPVEKLTEEQIDTLLFGGEEAITLTVSYGSYGAREYKVTFSGIFKMLEEQNGKYSDDAPELEEFRTQVVCRTCQGDRLRQESLHLYSDDAPALEEFRTQVVCPTCQGDRLRQESLHFKIADKNIAQLATMDISVLADWLANVEDKMDERQKTIAIE